MVDIDYEVTRFSLEWMPEFLGVGFTRRTWVPITDVPLGVFVLFRWVGGRKGKGEIEVVAIYQNAPPNKNIVQCVYTEFSISIYIQRMESYQISIGSPPFLNGCFWFP